MGPDAPHAIPQRFQDQPVLHWPGRSFTVWPFVCRSVCLSVRFEMDWTGKVTMLQSTSEALLLSFDWDRLGDPCGVG